MNLEKLFRDEVSIFSRNFIRVEVPYDKVKKVENFAHKMAKAKIQERHHQIDNRQEVKRHITGYMGEAALEELLGIDIIDYSIGDSSRYNRPDIQGYNVGIKTVEMNKFPVIFKNNYYPQIICIKSLEEDNVVYVCGLATTDILNQYQNDNLILNPQLRAKGSKTGFYGFRFLKPIKSLSDLALYIKRK